MLQSHHPHRIWCDKFQFHIDTHCDMTNPVHIWDLVAIQQSKLCSHNFNRQQCLLVHHHVWRDAFLKTKSINFFAPAKFLCWNFCLSNTQFNQLLSLYQGTCACDDFHHLETAHLWTHHSECHPLPWLCSCSSLSFLFHTCSDVSICHGSFCLGILYMCKIKHTYGKKVILHTKYIQRQENSHLHFSFYTTSRGSILAQANYYYVWSCLTRTCSSTMNIPQTSLKITKEKFHLPTQFWL